MIIIAFSNKTSRILPRILCRKYKHAAPIIPCGTDLIMYQFVRRGCVEKIKLGVRDLRILKSHGWEFVYIDGIAPPHDFQPDMAYTCVDLCKRCIGVKKTWVQTPFALYQELISVV